MKRLLTILLVCLAGIYGAGCIYIEPEAISDEEFEPFTTIAVNVGSGLYNGKAHLRLAVTFDEAAKFPFEMTEGCMAGMKISAVFTHKEDPGMVYTLPICEIAYNELNSTQTRWILIVDHARTGFPLSPLEGSFATDYTNELRIYPASQPLPDPSDEPFTTKCTTVGVGVFNGKTHLRLLIPFGEADKFPFDMTVGCMAGMQISGVFTHKEHPDIVYTLPVCTIAHNELNTNQTAWVLIVDHSGTGFPSLPPEGPYATNFTNVLTIYPKP
jgi:hypothetical protein